jgi:1-acyl-sn-glycerol-3-phosphate acyltransferase
MVNALSDDFNNVLYLCGFIVFIFLLFTFGRIEITLLTFIPLTVAWVWILGLMNIFDLKFNIVNIILATFIFGQGDDYTILVTEGLIYEYTYRKKMLAKFKNSIILSTTILFIGIGMLIFAKHPAMRSLAEVTIVGMISVVLCAFLFPPLIYRFLTTKKGKPREVPWTLKRFLRGVYAFVVFLLGSFVITIYGLVLLGFRKKWNGKNKLRYHRLLQRAANFVIRRVPGVKFRYENLSGETFDKPAVIICNHQSHLDLMCLMMLTPKLIILTNDWVWNNPFYGRLIQYADFYPVSKGIESSIGQLSEAVRRGYSIVIFPEGTRSADCSVGRFHRGAFYLAETLNLDILPVFLHGVGHVLPKNDFMLREGQITVQVRERITPDDSRFTAGYAARAKQIRQYYRETYAEISQRIETLDYFKSFVLHNYMYKGMEVWRGVKKELQGVKEVKESGEKTVLIENNGYGVYSFLYALANKDIQVIAAEEDEEKVAIAKNCAGIPHNLKIYHTSELHNSLTPLNSLTPQK